ncbi:MAG TPA: cisplatin damage response ATP-dependent DNA ligase [Hyphomicrobiaceae bacterium]|nr:cisplatin damage response ATP-dependent DNA ligase [Hyphomicrobiaceae bacterium]
MRAFAELLDRLSYTPGRNDKLRLMAAYFRETGDPDRGWALAALTGTMPFSFPLRRVLGEVLADKVDAQLYRMSRDYVGDTAETVALLWPEAVGDEDAGGVADNPLRLGDVVDVLLVLPPHKLVETLSGWLDRLDPAGRWALLKLLTGGLRVGVSARLAKTAIGQSWGRPVDDIEELWHGLTPPFTELFDWLEGRAARPDLSGLPVFRPMMLAHPLDESELAGWDLADYAIEWKWDGVRVQIASRGGDTRLYTRTGDEVGAAFPEIAGTDFGDVVVDGELLVVRDGNVAPFNDLQQRLNRKSVTKKQMAAFPAHVRLYDMLEHEGEDLRAFGLGERRARLESWYALAPRPMVDISEVLSIAGLAELQALWEGTREDGIEGLMVKRLGSPYLAGRPKGHWFKWKRAPLMADCVVMYAQRGSGRRSSLYSDYTFGAWREQDDGTRELVPVGKAYSGFTDEELFALDAWVRAHGRESYGPVRAVEPELVFEVAFDAIQKSSRHKSGIAMRFPRIHRVRWDKPADEAERICTLKKLVDS